MFDAIQQRRERRPLLDIGDPLTGSGQGDPLVERWRQLCSEFAPVYQEGELWRHSKARLARSVRQGWKIHVSATILTACDVLEIAGRYLVGEEVPFKCAASIAKLERLNAGLWHGYSQIGKFITIYPSDEEQFRKIVRGLAGLVPAGIAGPAVPFDLRYRETNIYYRYGSFVSCDEGGTMVRNPDGELVPDRRDASHPDWVAVPYVGDAYIKVSPQRSPLGTRYLVISSLSQRGKGGVYEAVDVESVPPRVCIVKEGRRNGETGLDGRDGRTRAENEVSALQDLRAKGVSVPEVYDSFIVSNNYYLVMERVEGEDLQTLLNKRQRRLSIGDTLYICIWIARLMADIHRAGRVWRDCKPANLFITKDKRIRPIDLEGSCPADTIEDSAWSSPKFAAPEVTGNGYRPSREFPYAEDLYSLGATLYYLVEAKLLSDGRRFTRRNVPAVLKRTVFDLLSEDPALRPTARCVVKCLESI